MKSNKNIPTIKPSLSDGIHFKETGWIDYVPEYNHLFHISRLEDYRDKMSFPLPAHRKEVYDMIFLTNGSSVRSKGLNKYTFGKNDVFFLPPHQITSHESLSLDVTGFFIHFSQEIFEKNTHLLKPFRFLQFLAHPIVTIPEEEQTPILYLFNRLDSLYNTQNTNLNTLVWYLQVLLTEINQFALAPDNQLEKVNTAAKITERYKDALTQYIQEKQTVSEYAKMLFVTPNYLNRCVKNTLNKSAKHLLNEMLILEAKSMLKYAGLSVAEIAEKLCQQTPSNFARFFKAQTGVTPMQYIKDN